MVILDSSNNAKYLQKYPKGYAIFGTFDKNIIIPGKSNLLQDYDIIWDDAAIMKYDEKTIQIMLPSFIYKPNRVSVNGNTIAIPRYKKDLSYKTIDFSPDEILIELIFDNGNILIFVIGVRARDPEIWEKRSDLHHIVTHPIWCDV